VDSGQWIVVSGLHRSIAGELLEKWSVISGQGVVDSGEWGVKWTLECVDAGMWEWELKRGQKYKYKLVLYLKL
jgi:hypothetical protein